ncbi:MAG: helix-turn-helix domain-containing protein [Thermonemataceae bacterium]
MGEVITFFSALALGHCLFLSVYLWKYAKKYPSARFLSFLLIALAIRLLKSVLIILFDGLPYVVPASGLIGTTLIGPYLWFYLQTWLYNTSEKTSGLLLHFLPAGILLLWQPFVSSPMIFYQYTFAALHLLAYLIAAGRKVHVEKVRYNAIKKRWVGYLFASLSALWLVFAWQLFIHQDIAYLTITVVATSILYSLSLWSITHIREILKPLPNQYASSQQVDELVQKIKTLFEQDKIYKDASLNLQALAKELKQPPYLVSKSINTFFQKSFPELLNHYRIKEATRLLQEEQFKHYSIEAVAYECGFNALSAFYTAFKKIHHITPAVFKKHRQTRKEHL